jgi:hypothetical protein
LEASFDGEEELGWGKERRKLRKRRRNRRKWKKHQNNY